MLSICIVDQIQKLSKTLLCFRHDFYSSALRGSFGRARSLRYGTRHHHDQRAESAHTFGRPLQLPPLCFRHQAVLEEGSLLRHHQANNIDRYTDSTVAAPYERCIPHQLAGPLILAKIRSLLPLYSGGSVLCGSNLMTFYNPCRLIVSFGVNIGDSTPSFWFSGQSQD